MEKRITKITWQKRRVRREEVGLEFVDRQYKT